MMFLRSQNNIRGKDKAVGKIMYLLQFVFPPSTYQTLAGISLLK
jgi:hypothetical protein